MLIISVNGVSIPNYGIYNTTSTQKGQETSWKMVWEDCESQRTEQTAGK